MKYAFSALALVMTMAVSGSNASAGNMSFAAVAPTGAKICLVDYYSPADGGYCKCKIDGSTVDLGKGYATRESCKKACNSFCTPNPVPVPRPPIPPDIT